MKQHIPSKGFLTHLTYILAITIIPKHQFIFLLKILSTFHIKLNAKCCCEEHINGDPLVEAVLETQSLLPSVGFTG